MGIERTGLGFSLTFIMLNYCLIFYFKASDILYYEVLDIPLPQLQCLKTLKIAFHHDAKDEVSTARWLLLLFTELFTLLIFEFLTKLSLFR